MAFTATFYNTSDPPNKIDKNLGTALVTATCTPFEQVSNLHGSILIDYVANVDKSNYATVTTGGRDLYCFVRDVIKDIGGHCRVELDIDPLTTNATDLKKCDCICETTCVKEKHNRYMPNSNLRATQLTIYSMENEEDISDLSFDNDGVIIGIYSVSHEQIVEIFKDD